MKPIVLFRSDNTPDANAEREIAAQSFQVVGLRSHVPELSLVIGRYSVLPYFRELELDLQKAGSRLLNNWWSHNWIANFVDYYEALREFTPRSWVEREFATSGYDGPVIIKGRTNSRKRKWRHGMWAANRAEAVELANELANDPLLGPQGLIYREYVPLVTFEHDPISGLPITNEWRCFFYKTTLLGHGYYWVTASDEARAKASCPNEAVQFACKLATIAAEHTNFFVLDIAEKQSGGWMLVEVNDGQQSGLSEVRADVLYPALKAALSREGHE
jgi:ATP-grasp domain-containing protein